MRKICAIDLKKNNLYFRKLELLKLYFYTYVQSLSGFQNLVDTSIQYMVGRICPLVRIGLRWLPKIGRDFSIYEWYRIKNRYIMEKSKNNLEIQICLLIEICFFPKDSNLLLILVKLRKKSC